MNEKLKDLILRCEEEINNNDWEEAYTIVSNTEKGFLIGDFTWAMISSGIDLTPYIKRIKEIPYRFLAGTPIESFIIPNGVDTVGNEAFRDCISLTSIDIPNNVTTLRDYVFFDCNKLTSVTIGDGVTTIGGNVFGYCSNLTEITYNGTIEQWKNIKEDRRWNYRSFIKKIICSDGDIELSVEGGN